MLKKIFGLKTQSRKHVILHHKKTLICLAMSGWMVDVEIVDGSNSHPSRPPTFSESQSGHFGFARIYIPPHEFMINIKLLFSMHYGEVGKLGATLTNHFSTEICTKDTKFYRELYEHPKNLKR